MEAEGHDAGYYRDLADAIGDEPYTNTEVFHEGMSMETFIAVIFKRGWINFDKQCHKIPIIIDDLSEQCMADSPPLVAKLTDADLAVLQPSHVPGPLRDELKKFIAEARKCNTIRYTASAWDPPEASAAHYPSLPSLRVLLTPCALFGIPSHSSSSVTFLSLSSLSLSLSLSLSRLPPTCTSTSLSLALSPQLPP